MKIRLFLFLLLSIAIKAKDSITLISRDKVKFNIALEAALLSNTIKNNLDYDKLKNNKNNIDYNKLKNNIDYDKSVLEDGLELDMFSAEELEIAVESLKQIAELYKERGKDTKKVLEYDYHDRENLIKENMASITELISNVIFGRLNVEYQNESIQEIIRLAILLNIGDFLQIYELIEGASYILSKKLIQPEVLELFLSGEEGLGKILHKINNIHILKFLPEVMQFLPAFVKLFTIEHSWRMYSVAMSPNSRYLAILEDYSKVQVWDIINREMLFVIDTKSTVNCINIDSIDSVIISSDSRYIVVSSYEGIVQVWDIEKRESVFTTEYERMHAFTKSGVIQVPVVISPDSRYLVVPHGGKVQVWDIENRRMLFVIDFSDSPKSIEISPDSRYLVVSENKKVQVWDIEEGKRLFATDTEMNNNINLVVISPDSKYLIVVDRKNVQVWGIENRKMLFTIGDGSTVDYGYIDSEMIGPNGIDLDIDSAVISPDSKYLVLVNSKNIQIWDLEKKNGWFAIGDGSTVDYGYIDSEMIGPNGIDLDIDSVVISPDSRYLVVVDRKNVHVWDIEKRNVLFVTDAISTADYDNNAVVISSDSRYLVVSNTDRRWHRSNVKLWDIKDCMESLGINYADNDMKVVISPDSRYVAIASGNEFNVWSIEDSENWGGIENDGHINSIEISYDGRYVVTTSGNVSNIWENPRFKKLEQILFIKLLYYLKEENKLFLFKWNKYLTDIFFSFTDKEQKQMINKFNLDWGILSKLRSIGSANVQTA